ncbi:hypothetical protein [Chryseolinea lacunae]|uniref:Uncharacterized protein n=1 Tax=Chryseolinea lacunae TaxID=2801331 RepID=A0ABS1KJM4_9BACT|nr:hypothetical protein [Chryseolinea lacunae]MBL0739659.1 hypothetical protein [Chryseolinea lacunae]
MKRAPWTIVLLFILQVCLQSCTPNQSATSSTQPVHADVAFQQDYSIKYNVTQEGVALKKVVSDRNGVISIFSSAGLLKPYAGSFLYPGTLVADRTYRPIADKKITALNLYQHQFVYADDKALLSNAWAGELYTLYNIPTVSLLKGGKDKAFLLSDGHELEYVKDGKSVWKGKQSETILDIDYSTTADTFWLLTANGVSVFSVNDLSVKPFFSGKDLTSFALTESGKTLVVGTHDGYQSIDAATAQTKGEKQTKLPATDITTVKEIGGALWFGTTQGAFKVRTDGKFDYYASKRWLPGDDVIDIAEGPEASILILTDKGLAQIVFKSMTLHEKANYFQRQVRARHVRHGFNATMAYMTDGSLATGSLEDSDNDGLWTTMYLGAEVFRYVVTKEDDALQNITEATEAMERLYTVNELKGFPSRSFERRGYKYDDKAWQRARHPEWDWKATTSSDEAIGHIFAFGVMAELLTDQPSLQKRAVTLIDSLMQHIVDNDMYMVDWDGKPTVWGRWNPEYVNKRPWGVGDRKINSANIIAMLQTAYYFTKKEVYKDKAVELMTKHGYFKNLMYPMAKIGKAAADADDWSKMLSESWNHSDDEMYFVGYWGLYRYALNDTLKTQYKDAIIDHWQMERPEKEAAWNIFTALTGTSDFDLKEAVWYLQEYPLDLIHWKVANSHRKDIEPIEPNFREQTTTEVLPPDELPINRHNANRFELDGGDGGASEYSAGDIWLLPYWMGRYLNVISAPTETKAGK